MRRLGPFVILLLATACGGGGDPAASTGASADAGKADAGKADDAKPDAAKPDAGKTDAGKTDAAKPESGKPDAAAKPKKPKPAPLSAKQANDLSKQFRTKLDEGRKQTKAGKFDEGIKLYHEALAIEPSNPAALAELGWAAFQAKQLELAQGASSQALTFSRKPEQQGMILYNLGRIAEARAEIDVAIANYRESLVRRPNATVQTRLDGLLASNTVAAVAPGLAKLASGVADLDAACKLLIDEESENLFMLDEGGCGCTTVQGKPDEGWALLEVGDQDNSGNALWFPAIKTSSGWVVFASIASLYNPGAFGIFEELQWSEAKYEDLLPGGELEWVLGFSMERTDSDMGINEFEAESAAATLVCTREGADAWCTEPMLSAYSYSREIEFAGEEYEGEDAIDHAGLPINRKFACGLTLGSTVVVADVVSDGFDASQEPWFGAKRLAAGNHELSALLGKTPAK